MFKRKDKRIKNDNNNKIYFYCFSVLIVFSLFSYGYFVRSTIVNIVDRQTMENSFSALNSDILELESNYIKVRNNITEDLALSLGFVNSTNKKFVTKNNDLILSVITKEF